MLFWYIIHYNVNIVMQESNSVAGASGTNGHQTNNPNTACVSTTPQCSSDGKC